MSCRELMKDEKVESFDVSSWVQDLDDSSRDFQRADAISSLWVSKITVHG